MSDNNPIEPVTEPEEALRLPEEDPISPPGMIDPPEPTEKDDFSDAPAEDAGDIFAPAEEEPAEEDDVLDDEEENLSVEGDSFDDAEDNAVMETDTAVRRRTRVRAPLIIAAVLLLVTILCFGTWMIFFNRSIIGSWRFTHKTGDSEYHTTFTFHEEGVDYYLGGRTYTGKYFLTKTPDQKDMVEIILTQFGSQVLDAKFYYEVSGNLLTGRTLTMTDLNGFLVPPDNLDAQDDSAVADKKKIAPRSIEEKGMRFYLFDFASTAPPVPEVEKIKNADQDKALLGIWYEENELSGYGDTFTFHEDGTYDIIYEDIRYTGCYSAKDGKCTYNICNGYGGTNEQSFTYSIEGDTLKLDFETFQSTLTKTTDQYAFRKEIK